MTNDLQDKLKGLTKAGHHPVLTVKYVVLESQGGGIAFWEVVVKDEVTEKVAASSREAFLDKAFRHVEWLLDQDDFLN